MTERAFSFGPFRLIPSQQLLLEDGAPVRLGGRALEILAMLVERAGDLVGKAELMARVWPDTLVDEGSLRVHVAGLRRALGDGQPGRRYLANAPGRGYRFVAPVQVVEPEERAQSQIAPRQARAHNLPLSQTRPVGRTDTVDILLEQLSSSRFVTIVGPGGIGKTTVALALAGMALPVYADGVWLADLAPLDVSRHVARAVGAVFGLTIHSENEIPQLLGFLHDKRLLIVLDTCEHVAEEAALLAEHILAAAPGVHILATSRELLRAEGERVYRLAPLEGPPAGVPLTAAEALAFPAVQLFIERASANLDGFELVDADAPAVADICSKLGGIALAIELAAARVDAFGVHQLSALLDDRFPILNRGKRTAQQRHRSLTAALDWSYEYLPESEQAVVRRLSIFVGAFTLGSAIAVASDPEADVIDGLANLVAKSLVSADIGGAVVKYRLLDITRAYAMGKLIEAGELQDLSRRHAEHHCDLLNQILADWQGQRAWPEDYARRIDDVRSALDWAFSPAGDLSIGVATAMAAFPLWMELTLIDECREALGKAYENFVSQSNRNEKDELKLLMALVFVLPHWRGPQAENLGWYMKALALSEKLGDLDARGAVLYQLSLHSFHVGELRAMLSYAQECHAMAPDSQAAVIHVMAPVMIGNALHYMGDHGGSRSYLEPVIDLDPPLEQRARFTYRVGARQGFSGLLWITGFPDRAMECAGAALDESLLINSALLLCSVLAQTFCPIALEIGDLAALERSAATLLKSAEKHGLMRWHAHGLCLRGHVMTAKGDPTGLAVFRSGLDAFRAVGPAHRFTHFLGMFAEALGSAGQPANAQAAIDEALERVDRLEERWCLPELLRVKGELALVGGASDKAESLFEQSLDWARRQGALSWELRTATSLARLWQRDGKPAEGADLLTGVYNRFTEGFDTTDLRAARALLDGLRQA